MIVQLEEGVYLADGEGDPPRTMIKENAKKFDSVYHALKAISDARKFRSFRNAKPVNLYELKSN